MPTRSASDYLSYVKAQVQTQVRPQAGGLGPKLTRTTPYNEGGSTVLNAITQASDMRYVTRGQAAPARVISRPFVLNRSNPKALSRVAFLGSAGPQGTLVSQPAARTSGTNGLVVLQTNLIQNANQNAGRSGNFQSNNAAITK